MYNVKFSGGVTNAMTVKVIHVTAGHVTVVHLD